MMSHKRKNKTQHPVVVNYEEHCGVETQDEESFFSLPEIRLCVGFYKYTLKAIDARSDLADVLKKAKLRPLQIEYANLCRAMKDTNTHMHLALKHPDDLQVQADLQELSKNLAEMCQIIIYRHKLRTNKGEQDENTSCG